MGDANMNLEAGLGGEEAVAVGTLEVVELVPLRLVRPVTVYNIYFFVNSFFAYRLRMREISHTLSTTMGKMEKSRHFKE